ncbi:MAG: serine/threonine protein kinase, partial [Chloroflexota bacterium]|nr:serine/threonine protein kinase [Chloroflexota bacterium]
EDPALQRDVAVKVLPRSLAADPNYVERFRNEAQRVANLNHPNITPVYTFGEEHGLLYLVMPRLKESLRERMEREGALPLQDAARLTNQIAAALYIAHQHGIVHRDVKPENILLDENGKAMLTDFGIAREMAALREAGAARTLAATGLPVGTPEYMAPEQLRNLPASERADLYALGVVLYEMLTARVPHDAATPYEVATAVLRDKPVPPTRYNHDLSPEVENVILTAMAKDPHKRYQDMKAFALALRAAVNTPTSQAINSGALRWTNYVGADGAEAGASGPRMGPSLANATSGLIRQPQIPLGETTKRPTAGYDAPARHHYGVPSGGGLSLNAISGIAGGTVSAMYSGLAAGLLGIRQRIAQQGIAPRSAMLLGGVALAALTALVIAGLVVSNALGLFSNSVGAPPLVAHGPTATATSLPTATPVPTATPRPTATPLPPAQLSVAPSTLTFNSFSSGSYCRPGDNSSNNIFITITNPDRTSVSWRWTSIQPSLPSLQWNLTGSTRSYQSGLPKDSSGIAAYDGKTFHSDMLYLRASCNSLQNNAPFTATMTDSMGRSYTITLKWSGGN